MTLLLLLTAVAAAMAAATTLRTFHDGRGPYRPPASHHDDDPRFRPTILR